MLQYCFSGKTLATLPRTIEDAIALQPAAYEAMPDVMTVMGFLGIEWSVDQTYGTTATYRYLKEGAPTSKGAKNIPVK